MNNNCDLLIIGAGPGGYETAAGAAARGLKVTLIERDSLGGTCLNRGCIPTKALCRAAEIVTTVSHAEEFGITTGGITVDYGKAVERKNAIVDRLREGVAQTLRDVNVVSGNATFTGPRTVTVGPDSYTADRIIIATGSSPARLSVPGAELCVTSDELLSRDRLPRRITIIGGGVIGIEFAAIFAAYGVDVTVLEYCKEILPAFDSEIAKRLRQLLSRRNGVKIITGACVTAINAGLSVEYTVKGSPRNTDADLVVMAVGRRPALPDGLDAAGITVTPKGIVTDGAMRTSASGVYAIGDVNGRCQLAHAATAQGRVALADILGKPHNINLSIIPAAVFTSPEAAMVGLTEEQCSGLDYSVAKSTFRANGKAMTLGDTEGLVKMIFNTETRAILGCHILGPHASDLIQEAATAMTLGATVDDIVSAIHGHPTLSEAMAAIR